MLRLLSDIHNKINLANSLRVSSMAKRMHVAKYDEYDGPSDMIALKATGAIGDDERRDREDSAGRRERKKRERGRQRVNGSETERENGRKKEGKDREVR